MFGIQDSEMDLTTFAMALLFAIIARWQVLVQRELAGPGSVGMPLATKETAIPFCPAALPRVLLL